MCVCFSEFYIYWTDLMLNYNFICTYFAILTSQYFARHYFRDFKKAKR